MIGHEKKSLGRNTYREEKKNHLRSGYGETVIADTTGEDNFNVDVRELRPSLDTYITMLPTTKPCSLCKPSTTSWLKACSSKGKVRPIKEEERTSLS